MRLDFKHSEASRFYFNAVMNKHDEHANIPELLWITSANNNHIVPGYTEQVTEWRPLRNSRVEKGAHATQKIGKAWNFQLGAVHRFDRLDVDYDVYTSMSETEYPGNKKFSLIARNIGMRIEQTDEPFRPSITQLSGPDWSEVSSGGRSSVEKSSTVPIRTTPTISTPPGGRINMLGPP